MVHWAMLLARAISHVADEIRIHDFTVSIRETLFACELLRGTSLLEGVRSAVGVGIAFFTLAVDACWVAGQGAVTICCAFKTVEFEWVTSGERPGI
jgi:hypothetical protein